MPRITRGLTHPSTAAGSSHPSRWRRTSGWGPWCRTPPTKTRRNKKEETKKNKKRTKKEQTEAFCEMDAHRVCTPLLTRKRMETKAARIRSEAWTEGGGADDVRQDGPVVVEPERRITVTAVVECDHRFGAGGRRWRRWRGRGGRGRSRRHRGGLQDIHPSL
jgi:hypothetical protein